MSDDRPDIPTRLRHTAGFLINGTMKDEAVPVALLAEAADEIERLWQTLQLHAGDVASLSGELDEWRERALAAEAELARPAEG